MEMTSRERLTAYFNNEIPDRVGSSFLINPYYTKSLPGNPEPLSVLKEVGADIIDRDCSLPYDKKFKNVEFRHEVINGETRISYETKIGKIWETYAGILSWGDLPFKKEHFIKTVEDYKIFTYILEDMEIVPNYDWWEERNELIGDHGIVVPQITEFRSSLEFLVEENLEKTIYDMMDYPDIVGTMMSAMREKNIEMCKVAAESPATVFNIWEDSSTTLLSPSMFEEYVLPEFKEFTEILDKSGKKLVHHACGLIKGLLPLMKTENVFAFESITPYTTGDVTLPECGEAWGDKFLMIGGLDPAFLASCTEEELEKQVVSVLDKLSDLRRKTVIANGDSLPPGVSIEKLKLIVDIAKRYKF